MKVILTAFGGRLKGEAHISKIEPVICFAMDIPLPKLMAIEMDAVENEMVNEKAEFELTSDRKFDPDTGHPIRVYKLK